MEKENVTDTEAIESEVASFGETLVAEGYHPVTARAYARKLREFLGKRPDALTMGADDLTEAVEAQIASSPPAYDTCTLSAALRGWRERRVGGGPARVRRARGDYRSSPDIDAEVERLRGVLTDDGLSGSTVESCCDTVSMFLGWRFPDGAVNASSITNGDAAEYLATEKSHLAATSRKTEAQRLGRYLGTVEGRPRGGLPFAPACWGPSSLPRMLGRDELEAIMAAGRAGATRSRNNAALLLMANLGLRCCEVAALDLSDVNFRGAVVTVPAVKGRCARRVPLDSETGRVLAEYVTRHRPRDASGGLLLGTRGTRTGRRVSTESLRSSLRCQARAAGVRDFGTHMLRRAAATGLVASGSHLKVAADVLGHSSVETTAGYLRLDPESLRRVASDWPEGGDDRDE